MNRELQDFTNILNEYVRVSIIIHNIHTKIDNYKKIIERRIERTNNENKQMKYVSDFSDFIDAIKKDKTITNQYKKLKLKEKILKEKIMNTCCSTYIHEKITNNITTNDYSDDKINDIIDDCINNDNMSNSNINIDDLLVNLRSKYDDIEDAHLNYLNENKGYFKNANDIDYINIDSDINNINNNNDMICNDMRIQLLLNDIQKKLN